ncbi:MAG: hypothetical protein GWP19_09630, partial [Planctomycetia bacterium]|nr:hypothetical protein [Planctomycetia bacterium]
MKYKNFNEWWEEYIKDANQLLTNADLKNAMLDVWEAAVDNFPKDTIKEDIIKLLSAINDAEDIDCTCDKKLSYLCVRDMSIQQAGVNLGYYLRKLQGELLRKIYDDNPPVNEEYLHPDWNEAHPCVTDKRPLIDQSKIKPHPGAQSDFLNTSIFSIPSILNHKRSHYDKKVGIARKLYLSTIKNLKNYPEAMMVESWLPKSCLSKYYNNQKRSHYDKEAEGWKLYLSAIKILINQKREETMKVNVEIAKLCNQVNRDYCINEQLVAPAKWDELPLIVQESIIAGVAEVIADPKITPTQ